MAEQEHQKATVSELAGLVEPEILDKLRKNEYAIREIAAVKLLSGYRLDLAFKLLYLKMRRLNPVYGTLLYLEHIKAFSFGTFKEPNNDEKTSKESFLEVFNQLSETISEKGFDREKSLLPLSNRGFIRNGAHRLSAAIFAKKNVFCIETEDPGRPFDYRFFYERAVAPEYLDAAATTFAEYADGVFIALVWPSAKGHNEALEEAIGNIAYKKEVNLSIDGARNLMPQVYPNEKWIGNAADNHQGSMNKVVKCFANDGPLRVFLFQSGSLEEVLTIKDKVREIFNVGKHSIHITDTRDEVLRLSKVLFNENSIHFLNNAKPNTFADFHQKLQKFKEFVVENNIDYEDIALDTSMILSAYGIRKSADVDYICNENYSVAHQSEGINSHNEELEFHGKTAADLLYDPANHFYFAGVKFIALDQLMHFKKMRGGEKDKIDLSVMEAIGSKDLKELAKVRRRQKIYYYKHKLKFLPVVLAIKLLKKLGLYKVIRLKYHALKTKKQ